MVQKVISSFFILLVTFLFARDCSLSSSSDNSGIQSEQAENLEINIEEKEPEELLKIRKFMTYYPDLEYKAEFDENLQDWKIEITRKTFFNRDDISEAHKALRKSALFYWAGGRLLPEAELSEKENYWLLQYPYENKLRDPKTYTAEEIERIKEFGSSSARKSDNGTPMFFFDFLYSAQSRPIIEEHIIKTKFLGKTTKVHERIFPALKRVEAKVCQLAGISTDELASSEKISRIDVSSELLSDEEKEIRLFIKSLKSSDAYYWREIAGTNRKSFHSYGIAIDLLPRRLNGRSIYWGWEKERSGDKWMMVPPEARWAPPLAVIKAFEEEGFIWGGYWIIFDNMHFEYQPQLIQ